MARLPRGLPMDHTTKFKGMTKLPGERKVCNAFHREEKTKKLRRDDTREKQSHQLVAHATREQEGHTGVHSLRENGLRAYSMPATCHWIFPKNKTGRSAADTRREAELAQVFLLERSLANQQGSTGAARSTKRKAHNSSPHSLEETPGSTSFARHCGSIFLTHCVNAAGDWPQHRSALTAKGEAEITQPRRQCKCQTRGGRIPQRTQQSEKQGHAREATAHRDHARLRGLALSASGL